MESPTLDSARWNQGLQALNCHPSEQQLGQLQAYLDLLQRWNKVYNLTAIRNVEDMLPLHLFDSLSVAEYLTSGNYLDVGSGAGLPGIPLAIMMPDSQFTLLDTNGKKTRFIQQAVIQLGLSNVQVEQVRVEQWQPKIQFDGIISRAFASLGDFIEGTAHHLQENGYFYAMKAKLSDAEQSELPANVAIEKVYKLDVPFVNADRHLIKIKSV